MNCLAPAKINLHLRVGPLAADRFHPLLSWMCTIGLFDNLTIETRSDDRVECSTDDASLPTDERNLAVRAALAMRALLPDLPGVRIVLEKRIPSGAGLGGGSSDAAAVMMAMNNLSRTELPLDAIVPTASALGSDVPFFLYGPSSACRGRGEIVMPVAPPTAKWCLLILPGWHVATPAVYRKFDEMQLGESKMLMIENEPNWKDWSRLAATELLPLLVNDLEAPAFALEPRLPRLRQAAETIAARPVRMSGSGSSLFTLYDEHDFELAQRAAEEISESCETRVEVVSTAPSRST